MSLLPAPPALATSLRALAGHPLRTTLSTLGIVMGVASLVAVLSVGDGVEAYSRAELSRGTDLLLITVRPRTTVVVDGITFSNPDHPVFVTEDLVALRHAVPQLARVSLLASGPGMVRGPDSGPPRAAMIMGQVGLPDRELHTGRYFTSTERPGSDRLAVVSYNLAEALGGVSTVIGSTIQVGPLPLEVIGVMRASGDRLFLVDVPMGALPLAVDSASRRGPTPELVAEATRLEEVAAARAGIEAWLDTRIDGWRSQVAIEQNQRRLEQARQAMGVFKLFMGSIVSISLLVGGIGIMNVLLASVVERTREIGIRRAAGARRRDVLWQFLTESVVVTGLGSGIGLVTGFTGAVVITAVMRAQTEAEVHAALAWPTVVIAAGAALVVGLLFGLYPALRAARLSPIDAIRHE